MFRRRRFLAGADVANIGWFTPAGTPMDGGDWSDPNARCLAIHLDGQRRPRPAADGTPLVDDDFLVLVNGWWEPLDFVVPDVGAPKRWVAVLDTHAPDATSDGGAGDRMTVGPQAITVLRSPRPAAPGVGVDRYIDTSRASVVARKS